MDNMQVVERPMARTKRTGRPVTSERDDVVVKIDTQVAAKARYVASTRKITLAEYLSELIRPLVDRDFDRAVKENQK